MLALIVLGLVALVSLPIDRQDLWQGKTVDAWILLARDRDPQTRVHAISVLLDVSEERVKDLLLAALDDPSIDVRRAAFIACWVRGYLSEDQRLSAVRRQATDASGQVPYAIFDEAFDSCVRSLGAKAAPILRDLHRIARELRAKPETSTEDEAALARIAEYIEIIGGKTTSGPTTEPSEP